MKAVHVWVSGHVQGVFFRASTQEAAESRGVAGWVRNRADGRVEAFFEGPDDDVDAVVAWCEDGPTHARVVNLEIDEVAPEGHDGFTVRPTL